MAPNTQNPAEVHHATRQQTAARIEAPAGSPSAAPVQAAPQTAPAAAAPTGTQQMVLSLGVVKRSDISKGLRELQAVDDYFHQASIRGGNAGSLPSVSKTLDSLAQANGLNLVHAEHRSALKDYLSRLKSKAPVVHLSFPSEPSDPFVERILDWFRKNVHPDVVLHIGLQPELAAGCMVRTTNKMFDFSLRKRFEQSKQKLMQALEELEKAAEHQPVAAATATVDQGARL